MWEKVETLTSICKCSGKKWKPKAVSKEKMPVEHL